MSVSLTTVFGSLCSYQCSQVIIVEQFLSVPIPDGQETLCFCTFLQYALFPNPHTTSSLSQTVCPWSMIHFAFYYPF